MREKGLGFGTRTSALQAKHTRRARAYETFGVLNPKFAAAGDKEAAERFIERLLRFRERYADCRRRFLAGERDVIWPIGTWKMHAVHGLPRRAPP